MPRRAEDLSGKKFERLTVLERAWNYPVKGVFWKCKCDCGNERIVRADRLKKGETKSCGCFSRDCLIKYNKEEKAKNLLGKKFGRWLVLEKTDKRESGSIVWLCECECGNQKEIRATSLIAGETMSCGCIQYKDISNQKFGKLTAIKEVDSQKNLWLCSCECGNQKIVDKKYLLRGHVLSCGCLSKSFGEEKISKILQENNIPFEREKIFNDCRFEDTNGIARFDFYINNQYIIEYDGIQHFVSDSGYGKDLKNIQKRDLYKNEYCKNHNIPLIRIPYTHLNKISLQDLLLETSSFVLS